MKNYWSQTLEIVCWHHVANLLWSMLSSGNFTWKWWKKVFDHHIDARWFELRCKNQEASYSYALQNVASDILSYPKCMELMSWMVNYLQRAIYHVSCIYIRGWPKLEGHIAWSLDKIKNPKNACYKPLF